LFTPSTFVANFLLVTVGTCLIFVLWNLFAAYAKERIAMHALESIQPSMFQRFY